VLVAVVAEVGADVSEVQAPTSRLGDAKGHDPGPRQHHLPDDQGFEKVKPWVAWTNGWSVPHHC